MSNAGVLVTGAKGFLGRHVARCMARTGHRVIGIGHGDWPQHKWESWGLSAWHPADVTLTALRQFADRPATIIHCAGGGLVSFSITDPLADFASTVVSTAHVLEYVRLHAPECRVIYPSSASVYGAVKSIPIAEHSAPAPISQYGTHKLMAEEMVSSYARQFGSSTAIVRLFSVYGRGLRKQLLWDASCKLQTGQFQFMGTGNELRDWLHVEDAAELLLSANHNASPANPIVNGGTGIGVSVREVIQHLGHALLGHDVAAEFTGVERAGDPSRYVADIERARSWGWRPSHCWKEGVADYAAWRKADPL